jgi:SAM-dependent methyltransferase
MSEAAYGQAISKGCVTASSQGGLSAAQALWGEGNTQPAEQRFAMDLATALKLRKDKDIAVFGSGLCSGARAIAGQLKARVSCYEWDAGLYGGGNALNARSSAGFLIKTHHIAFAEGFPAGRQYDCVFVVLRLHQRPDKNRLIKQLAGALKPGGTLCLVNYLSGSEPLPADARARLFADAAPGPLWRATDLHFALVSTGLEVGVEFDVTAKFRDAIVAGFGGMKDVVLAIMRQQANAGEALTQEVKLWAARHDLMKSGQLEVRCTFAMKREARAGA